ncbi:hypothetical protein HYC85_005555 [Camellia sinensis]|uniref:Chromo domain-containing protein n=1 Tax=Camellia sinensis TaxID=4442 RepID=A0A7J7HZU6_CAMSI|nr:hypothetical protein HYC85_005555 [Camellia sinensis]
MDTSHVLPTDGEDAWLPATEPTSNKRKCRGSTTLPDVIKDRSSGVRKAIDYNENGQLIGNNSIKCSSYHGVLARTMIPICYKDWFEVPAKLKEKLWSCVEVSKTLKHKRMTGSAEDLDRSVLWKKAHQNKNGEYDDKTIMEQAARIDELTKQKSDGSLKIEGCNDILTMALGTPESSSQGKPCKLAIGSIENIVAHGTLYERIEHNEAIHTVPLGESNVRVSVEVVIQKDAPLPIPIPDEMFIVGEAVGFFVAWPKNLVLVGDECMLRGCVLDFSGTWERHLPLVEFPYNNSFQSSIGMAPFEALYGRPCRSPVCWAEVGDAPLLGPELVRETTEKVELIRRRLVTAQSRQKSCADRRRRPLAFETGDHVFLKISPKRGLMRFGKSGKLCPRFIGPFEILERIGEVVYRLALPPQLFGVHDVFHVSMLRKYEPDPSHVLDWTDLEVDEDASYEERPVRVLDRRDQVLRGKTIPLVKVLWKRHGVEEATWEYELEVHEKYPDMFVNV